MKAAGAGGGHGSVCGLPLGVFLIVTYMFVSTSIVFVNKAVLSQYHFGAYVSVLTLAQTLTTAVALRLLKAAGQLQFPALSVKTAIACAPLTVVHVLNVLSGLGAAGELSIPMLTALRRMGSLFVIALDWCVARKATTMPRFTAVCIMISGAFIAGAGDARFTVKGMALVTLSNVATALQLVLVRSVQAQDKSLTEFTILFNNSVCSLPLLVLIAWVPGDLAGAWAFLDKTDLYFFMCFGASCLLAGALNYTLFRSSTVNSPLTTSVVGQIKGIGQTALGLFAFGDVAFTWANLTGLAGSSLGSVYYAYIDFAARTPVIPPSQPKPDASTAAAVALSSPASGVAGTSVAVTVNGGSAAETELQPLAAAARALLDDDDGDGDGEHANGTAASSANGAEDFKSLRAAGDTGAGSGR